LIPAVGSLLWVTSGVWIIAYLIGGLAAKIHSPKDAAL
jgi:hypothetical protein